MNMWVIYPVVDAVTLNEFIVTMNDNWLIIIIAFNTLM